MKYLHKVWEPHEVAVGVDDEWGGEVSGLDEQKGRVHPEDCRVGELEISVINGYSLDFRLRWKRLGTFVEGKDTWNIETRNEVITSWPFLILSTIWWK